MEMSGATIVYEPEDRLDTLTKREFRKMDKILERMSKLGVKSIEMYYVEDVE